MAETEALSGNMVMQQVANDEQPSYLVNRRPSIKLASKPNLVICMPVGDKEDATFKTCPQCKAGLQEEGIRAHGLVSVQWATNHMQIVPPLNCSMQYMFEFGRLAAEAREILTHRALETGAEFIFYWDDDVLIPPLALYQMYNYLISHPEIGAVAGVYVTREEHGEPIIYKYHGQGAYWGFCAGEGGEPEEIFSTGGGCLLVRTSVIKKMTTPYWADGYQLNDDSEQRVTWGHDVRFCVKIQQEGNMPLYMMPDVLCGHWDIHRQKAFVLEPDSPPLKRWRHKNAKQYWEDVWGNNGFSNAPRFEAISDWQFDTADWWGNDSFLDLGCGVGLFMQKAGQVKGWKAKGIDFAPTAISLAKALYLDVEEMDLRNLPPEGYDYNIIAANFLFEWIDAALAERILENASKYVNTFICTVELGSARNLKKRDVIALLKRYFPVVITKTFEKGKILAAVCRQGDD